MSWESASSPLEASLRGAAPAEQLRVHEGHARQHVRAAQAGLHLRVPHAQHRVARHLGAGPRRGGNGHQGQRGLRQRLPPAHDLQVVERISSVGGQRGDGLARVQRAASAEGHHRVAPRAPRPWPCPPAPAPRVGSPSTAKVTVEGRAARAPRAAAPARAGVRPVTSSTLCPPRARTASGASASLPGPKRMRVAVANSKSASRPCSPPRVLGEPVDVLPGRCVARPSSAPPCRATSGSGPSPCARPGPGASGRPRRARSASGPRCPG